MSNGSYRPYGEKACPYSMIHATKCVLSKQGFISYTIPRHIPLQVRLTPKKIFLLRIHPHSGIISCNTVMKP